MDSPGGAGGVKFVVRRFFVADPTDSWQSIMLQSPEGGESCACNRLERRKDADILVSRKPFSCAQLPIRLLFELYNGLSQYLCGRLQILGAHREPLPIPPPVKIELSFDYFDA